MRNSMSKSINMRDQIICSRNHMCNVAVAQGEKKVDKVRRASFVRPNL